MKYQSIHNAKVGDIVEYQFDQGLFRAGELHTVTKVRLNEGMLETDIGLSRGYVGLGLRNLKLLLPKPLLDLKGIYDA